MRLKSMYMATQPNVNVYYSFCFCLNGVPFATQSNIIALILGERQYAYVYIRIGLPNVALFRVHLFALPMAFWLCIRCGAGGFFGSGKRKRLAMSRPNSAACTWFSRCCWCWAIALRRATILSISPWRLNDLFHLCIVVRFWSTVSL